MILPIYVYGQPVLREEAKDIDKDYPNLKELIANMHETMDRADGVGLAAPQVGLPIRVVVVNLDVLSDDMPEFKGFRRAYINPHILETGEEEVSMEEGCLSLPGIHESVKRPTKIHVKYLDEEMNEHDDSLVTGRLSNNALVHFKGDVSLIGQIVTVRLTEAKGFYYFGEPV